VIIYYDQFLITKVAPNFWSSDKEVKSLVLIVKMGWASFWAFFQQRICSP
jgi:hypothetical protein